MDAHDLMWEEIQTRLDDLGWKHKPLVSRSRFEFSQRRKLYIIGAEKIRRVRGHKAFYVAMDEVAYYTTPLKTVWQAVKPTLTDLKGSCDIGTTPNGKGTDCYDFYLQVLGKENWKYFHWYSTDNPHLPKEEIEAAKREMDEKAFKAEYMASWESFEGLAYYSFDEQLNIKDNIQAIEEQYPIDICLDFNVNPTTLLVAQYDNHLASIKKEYSFKNSSTQETVKAFCEDHKNYSQSALIRIFGDASGNARSSPTGMSDYYYIKEILKEYGFRFEVCILAANPPIVDRVSHTNAWLKNVHNQTRVFIDKSCKDLIRDLASQEVAGRIPLAHNNLGHKADALGYYIHWLHLKAKTQRQGTRFL